jgi:predicted ATP-dependent serine protease
MPMSLNTKLILIAGEIGISKNALMLQALWEYVEKKGIHASQIETRHE